MPTLDDTITFRVDSGLRGRLQGLAESRGLTLSGFFHGLAVEIAEDPSPVDRKRLKEMVHQLHGILDQLEVPKSRQKKGATS